MANATFRDALERMFWTGVVTGFTTVPTTQITASVAGGSLDGLATVGLSFGAAFVGAFLNGILVFARQRLSVLPDPGAGLPGLPVPPPGG